MKNVCKKCLLLEAGETALLEDIKALIDNVAAEDKADKELYIYRLEKCKECKNLISGMCFKCGCFVELRAAYNGNCCADYDNKRW